MRGSLLIRLSSMLLLINMNACWAGKQLWTIEKHLSSPIGPVTSLIALPSGQLASSSMVTDESIKVWDSDLKNVVRTLNRKSQHGQQTCNLAALPDGNIVSGFIKTTGGLKAYSLLVWDPVDGSLIDTIRLDHADIVTDVMVLPGNLIATASRDKTIKLWHSRTHENVRTFSGHAGSINSIDLLAEDRLVSGSSDKTVKIFSLSTGQRLADLHVASEVQKVLALPNGQVAAACLDGQIKILDRVDEDLTFSKLNLTGHESAVLGLAVSPSGFLISSSSDKKIRRWSYEGNSVSVPILGVEKDYHTMPVASLTSLPNDRVASTSLDMTIKLWDSKKGSLLEGTSSLEYNFKNLVTYKDGYVAGSDLNVIYIWNPSSGGIYEEQHVTESEVTCLLVLGDLLVSAEGGGTLKTWRRKEKEHVSSNSNAHGGAITSLVALPGDKFASASRDKKVKVWTSSLVVFKDLNGHAASVNTLAVRQNGNLLSGSDDRTIKTFNPTTGDLIRSFNFSYPIKSIAILNASHAAITFDAINEIAKNIEVINLNDGFTDHVLRSHQGAVTSLVVLDNGYLASGSIDRSIKLWNALENELISTLAGHADEVYSMTIQPQSHLMSSSNRELITWKLDLDFVCAFDRITAKILRCPELNLNYIATEVNLGGKNIKSIEADSFAGYKKISKLDLKNNQINFLDVDTFTNQANLDTLYLGDNRLSSLDPNLFKNNSMLKTLHLGSNQFTTIPGDFFKHLRALTDLDLQSNLISELDVGIFSKVCLKELNLNRNPIDRHIFKRNNTKGCLEVFDTRKSLKLTQDYLEFAGYTSKPNAYIIDVSNRNIDSIDSATFEGYRNTLILDLSSNVINVLLPGQFDALLALDELVLSNNRLSSIPAGLFAKMNRLKLIRLNHNLLTEIDSNTFKDLESSVERIDLRDNKLSKIDKDSFKNLTKLRRVYLQNNPIVNAIGIEEIQSLCSFPCLVLA